MLPVKYWPMKLHHIWKIEENNHSSEWVNKICIAPSEHVLGDIMFRISSFLMKLWWYLLCTRPQYLFGFYSANTRIKGTWTKDSRCIYMCLHIVFNLHRYKRYRYSSYTTKCSICGEKGEIVIFLTVKCSNCGEKGEI
jgi:hypothetical protein